MPKVSVVMNCYNSAAFLREAIDSVFNQTYQDWEIIFWDNASTDKSPEIAKSYSDKVIYYRGEKTVPLSEARNFALEKATGELIGFLDCDDLWMPNKLEMVVKCFDDYPDVGLVYSNSAFFIGDKDVCHNFKTNSHRPEGFIFRALLASNFLATECVMFRAKCLEGLDEYFDNKMFVALDADLFLRISIKCKVKYVDAVLSRWRMHSGSLTNSRYDLISRENEIILSKLRKLIPNFERDYKDEIGIYESKIAFQKGLMLFQKGNSKEAREVFRQIKGARLKYKLAYWMTYFPLGLYRLYHYIYYKYLKEQV